MGGRGASSGMSDKKKKYGTEYETLHTDGNIKFVRYKGGNAKTPMETMTKNLSGIGAMLKTQAVENGLTVLTLPQLENMAVTLISHSMKLQENLDFYY